MLVNLGLLVAIPIIWSLLSAGIVAIKCKEETNDK